MYTDGVFRSPTRTLPSLPRDMEIPATLPRGAYLDRDDTDVVSDVELPLSSRTRAHKRSYDVPEDNEYDSPPSFHEKTPRADAETEAGAGGRHRRAPSSVLMSSEVSSGRIPLDVTAPAAAPAPLPLPPHPAQMSPSSPIVPAYSSILSTAAGVSASSLIDPVYTDDDFMTRISTNPKPEGIPLTSRRRRSFGASRLSRRRGSGSNQGHTQPTPRSAVGAGAPRKTREHSSPSLDDDAATQPQPAVFRDPVPSEKLHIPHFHQPRKSSRAMPIPVRARPISSSQKQEMLTLRRSQLFSGDAGDSLYKGPGSQHRTLTAGSGGHLRSPSSEQPRPSARRSKTVTIKDPPEENSTLGRLYRSHSHRSVFDTTSSGYLSSHREPSSRGGGGNGPVASRSARAPLPPQFRRRGSYQPLDEKSDPIRSLLEPSRREKHPRSRSPSRSTSHMKKLSRSKRHDHAPDPAHSPPRLQHSRSPSLTAVRHDRERSRGKRHSFSAHVSSQAQRSRSPSAPAVREVRSRNKRRSLPAAGPSGSPALLVGHDPLLRPRSRSPSAVLRKDRSRSNVTVPVRLPSQVPAPIHEAHKLQTVSPGQRPRSRSPSLAVKQEKSRSRGSGYVRSPSQQPSKLHRGQSVSRFSQLQTVTEANRPRSRSPSRHVDSGQSRNDLHSPSLSKAPSKMRRGRERGHSISRRSPSPSKAPSKVRRERERGHSISQRPPLVLGQARPSRSPSLSASGHDARQQLPPKQQHRRTSPAGATVGDSAAAPLDALADSSNPSPGPAAGSSLDQYFKEKGKLELERGRSKSSRSRPFGLELHRDPKPPAAAASIAERSEKERSMRVGGGRGRGRGRVKSWFSPLVRVIKNESREDQQPPAAAAAADAKEDAEAKHNDNINIPVSPSSRPSRFSASAASSSAAADRDDQKSPRAVYLGKGPFSAFNVVNSPSRGGGAAEMKKRDSEDDEDDDMHLDERKSSMVVEREGSLSFGPSNSSHTAHSHSITVGSASSSKDGDHLKLVKHDGDGSGGNGGGRGRRIRSAACRAVLYLLWLAVHGAYIAFGVLWLLRGWDIPFALHDGYNDGVLGREYLGYGVISVGFGGILLWMVYFISWQRFHLPYQFWIPSFVALPVVALTSTAAVWVQWSTREGDPYSWVTVVLLVVIFGELFLRIRHAMKPNDDHDLREELGKIDRRRASFDKMQYAPVMLKEYGAKRRKGDKKRRQRKEDNDAPSLETLAARVSALERKTHNYPRNAYSLLMIMFNFYMHLKETHEHPTSSFVRHFLMPISSLMLSIFTQAMFIGFVYVNGGSLCVCINTTLLNPVLAGATLAFFVVVVYLDILESFQMMEFQLLRNTRPHVVRGMSFGTELFASMCLFAISGFFALKVAIAIFLIVVAAPFLFSSTDTSELILNALLLLFILEIDMVLYKYALQPSSPLGTYMDAFFASNPVPAREGTLMDASGGEAVSKLLRTLGYACLVLFALAAVYKECDSLFFRSVSFIREQETFDVNSAPACLGLAPDFFAERVMPLGGS